VNRKIKTFGHDGEFLDDSVAMIARVAAENAVAHEMRDKGYAKILDLDVGWYTQYEPNENRWQYSIRAYGIYVGKRKARECEGWTQGKLIPRNTSLLTSKQ
jgi:hypothetical protein